MRRLEVIDGLRGYFLIFMLLNHLAFTGGYLLVKFNHSELGFVQDVQGFVFLSGLLVGIVYGRRMMKAGFAAGSLALWRRAGELYAYTIGCVLVVFVLREILPQAGTLWQDLLGGLGNGGVAFRAAGALLLYQVTYLDVLPQYVVYFLAAPPLVWLCVTGRWLSVALACAILWFAVQTGVHLPIANALNGGLAGFDPDLSVRVPFNVLGWQLIFFGAMVIGVLWMQGKIPVERIFDPDRTILVKAACAALVIFAAFKLGFTLEVVPESVTQRFFLYGNRAEFGLVFLLNFLALGYVITWVIVAGPRSRHRPIAGIGRALTFVFTLSFLRLLGRHSLQIYAWHVVLVYLVLWLDRYAGPFDELTKTGIAVLGVALLAVPAVYLERRNDRRARAELARPAA
jgi:hypothetical protein